MRITGSSSGTLATSAPVHQQFGMFGESPEPSNAVDLRRVWRTIVRRRRLLIGVFGGFFIVVMILTLLQTRTYTVSTKLIAGGSTPDADPSQNDKLSDFPILNALSANSQQSAETYAELLSETPVFADVVKNLGLQTNAATLAGHMTVKPVTNTSILNVQFSWSDRFTAARIANAIASAFVERERELVSRDPANRIQILNGLVPAQELKMDAAQHALAAYQKETGVADLDTQKTSIIDAQAALEAKLNEAEQALASANQSASATESDLGHTPATIVGQQLTQTNPNVTALQQKISAERIDLQALQSQYQPDFPPVIQAQAALKESEAELAKQQQTVNAGTSVNPNPNYQQLVGQDATYKAQAAAASAQISAINGQLKDAQPELDQLPEVSRRITQLSRAAKAAQDEYDSMKSQLSAAELAQKDALADIAVSAPADPSVFTTTPNTLLNAMLGAVVGAVLALSVVFIVEFFDDRMRTIEDVRERLALPVLATIPKLALEEAPSPGGGDTTPKKREPDWIRQLSVESFYQLVASLRYTSTTPPRTIAFTSAQQGDGKSTIAVNTAISMALMKARVLVIDADLRRPSVHTKLGISNERGLSDALVGLADFSEVVKPTDHDGVWVVTSGRKVPNPFALLQSDAFEQFVQRARERFDFVIVDGPALSSIVDGLVIGLKTDGTVIVVNADSTEGRSAQAVLAKLRAVPSLNIIGVVLNGTRPDPSEYSDYYLGDGQSMALPPTAAR